jgi:prevent-host-death family protein
MEVLSVAEAREQFSELMAKVSFGGQRIVVERRGRPMMAWVSIEDLHRLEAIEHQSAERKVARLAALERAAAVRHRIQQERGGALLPDSSDLLETLRNERVDELAGMR